VQQNQSDLAASRVFKFEFFMGAALANTTKHYDTLNQNKILNKIDEFLYLKVQSVNGL
jgi:hypothetical protein